MLQEKGGERLNLSQSVSGSIMAELQLSLLFTGGNSSDCVTVANSYVNRLTFSECKTETFAALQHRNLKEANQRTEEGLLSDGVRNKLYSKSLFFFAHVTAASLTGQGFRELPRWKCCCGARSLRL